MKHAFSLLVTTTLMVSLSACNIVNQAIGGSCRGSQDVAGTSIEVCTENTAATVDQTAQINAACRSGAFGSAANMWVAGQFCAASNRVGGCRNTANGVTVTTWFYSNPNAPQVNSMLVESVCTQGGGAFVLP